MIYAKHDCIETININKAIVEHGELKENEKDDELEFHLRKQLWSQSLLPLGAN